MANNSVVLKWDKGVLSKLQKRFMQGVLIMAYDLAADARSGDPGAPVLSGDLKASIRVEKKQGCIEVVAGGIFNGTEIKYAKKQEYTNPNGHKEYMKKPFDRLFGNNDWKDKYFGKVAG